MTRPLPAAGVVLCGGKSSRMGRPKALLPWQGRPMVVHLVEKLRELVEEVVVVASRGLELPKLEALVVEDREPGLGPLGGIREGLHAARADLVLVIGTDAPHLPASFVEQLLSFGETTACRVGGVIQPLPAVYARALAGTADALIEAGRMRPIFLLEAANHHLVEEGELESLEAFRSFNTPEEYARELERSAGGVDPGLRG